MKVMNRIEKMKQGCVSNERNESNEQEWNKIGYEKVMNGVESYQVNMKVRTGWKK